MSFSKGDYVSDLDALKRWWDYNQTQAEPKPYFTIFRGLESKSDRVVFRNTEISDVAEAWDALEDILDMHTQHGGFFKIYITSKPLHNIGVQTLYKVHGQNPNQTYPGIGNMMNGQKMYTEDDLNRERQIWELQQSIRDLKAEQDAKMGEMDGMMGEFMPIIKDLAHKFGLRMITGQPAQQPAPPAAGLGNYNPDAGPASEGFDYDRLEPALDHLREVFPDTETAIEKLARWARENPDTAKSLMSTL